MYHRVAEETCDPWGLCVSPRHFDEQMAALAERRAANDLAAFARPAGFSRDGSRLAVTFDDGYVDNISEALPILEKHDIPATIFVVAGTLGNKREFWWDALARAFFESGPLPTILDLPLDGGIRRYHLDDDGPRHRTAETGWLADETDATTPRQHLFLNLWSVIVLLDAAAQDAAVDHILAWAGCPVAPPAGRIPATKDAIAHLATHPLIRIGSHTRDHVSLTDLPSHAQQMQIEQGHHMLETIIGQRIDRFSYPFGRHDATTVSHVRALGIDMACTSHATAATPRMDVHSLPRLQVANHDGESFARWLRDDHGLLTQGI